MTDPHSFDRETIHKLLGGYATGTLTPEEQQALFEAALTDQELFDALAREQSLRDLLRDPAARAQLLSAIDDQPLPWYRRFWRPVALVATAAACFLVGGVFVVREHRQPVPVASPILSAENKEPPPVVVPAPPPPPPQSVASPEPENRPAPRREMAMKKVPILPAAPEAAPADAAKESAKDAVTERKAEAVGSIQARLANPVAPLPAAAPMGAPGGLGGALPVEGRLQAGSAGASSFQEAGSKSIPLQSAQALFYAAPQANDLSMQAGQFFAPRQQTPQQQTQQQQSQQQQSQQQRDDKLQVQSSAAMKTLARSLRVPNLGVKWTLLRQRDGGDFIEVPPDQLQAGDSVKLKLVPNDDGFLSISQGPKVLKTVPVKRLGEVESPVITADRPGPQFVTVQLTRTVPQPGLVRNAVEQQSATDNLEHATYVMNANTSQAAPFVVTIPLTFK